MNLRNNESFITNVNLDNEMTMIFQHLEQEIKATNARIDADFTEVNVTHTVKPYLDSILYNLVSNAMRYRHPERAPLIQLKATRIKNEICLSVSVNGLGIDLSLFKHKLFTLYSRLHKHVEGKGMGLYLVKTQMLSMGGRIEVESEVNKGTTFKAYL